jgi:hypothetical protein
MCVASAEDIDRLMHIVVLPLKCFKSTGAMLNRSECFHHTSRLQWVCFSAPRCNRTTRPPTARGCSSEFKKLDTDWRTFYERRTKHGKEKADLRARDGVSALFYCDACYQDGGEQAEAVVVWIRQPLLRTSTNTGPGRFYLTRTRVAQLRSPPPYMPDSPK